MVRLNVFIELRIELSELITSKKTLQIMNMKATERRVKLEMKK